VKPGIAITKIADVVIRNVDESCEKEMVTTGISQLQSGRRFEYLSVGG
jgi:hypothetical protein